MGLKQMSAGCSSVSLSQYDVSVDDGFALKRGYVADHGEHFDLLVYRQRMVELAVKIEPCRQRAGDGANAGEVRVSHMILFGEVSEAAKYFVAFAEDDGVYALAILLAPALPACGVKGLLEPNASVE